MKAKRALVSITPVELRLQWLGDDVKWQLVISVPVSELRRSPHNPIADLPRRRRRLAISRHAAPPAEVRFTQREKWTNCSGIGQGRASRFPLPAADNNCPVMIGGQQGRLLRVYFAVLCYAYTRVPLCSMS